MSYRLSIPGDNHDHISCDVCDTSGFSGSRYKCLVCEDYDLCGNCQGKNSTSGNHRAIHPMQCILSRRDAELLYAGEPILSTNNTLHSLTCPYCGELGFTLATLFDHAGTHMEQSREVICPVCVGAGDSNMTTPDLATHLDTEHMERPDLRRPGNSSIGLGRGRPVERARRTGHITQTAAVQRESDAIAELLSQLTEARGLRQGVLGSSSAGSIGIAAPQIQRIPAGPAGLRRPNGEESSGGLLSVLRSTRNAVTDEVFSRDNANLLLPKMIAEEERKLAARNDGEEERHRTEFVRSLMWELFRKSKPPGNDSSEDEM